MCVLHARLSPYESILTSTFRFKSTTVVLHAYNIYLIYRILTSSQHHARWTFDTMVCGRYGTRQNPKQLSNRKWKGGHVATSFINEMVALCFPSPLQRTPLAHGRAEHQYKAISILVHNQKAPEGIIGPFIIRWVVPVPGMPGQKRLHSFILVLPVDRQGNNWLIWLIYSP